MNILITGGSGLLGSELHKLLPEAMCPTREELDVSNAEEIFNYFRDNNPDLIIHCAGFMPPNKVDMFAEEALYTNIIGTALLVDACMAEDIPIFYISTDYVFNGEKGYYEETDEVLPVNKYGWSKLGGECAVRMHDLGLIIRTSFGPRPYPYDSAFTDQWTSKEPVDVIAKKIVSLIGKNIYGVIHLGGDRKTVYEYAKEISADKDIKPSVMPSSGYVRPVDTSLDTSKFRSLK